MRRAATVLAVLLATSAYAEHTHLAKPKHGFQMRVGKYTVEPNQDLEVCEYRRLPNAKPMDVDGFKLKMPAGAHHFVIWSYTGSLTDDAAFPKGPVPSVACSGLAPDQALPGVLIPIQQPSARFRFPEGVALRLAPHQQVWLNPHMKNYGTEAFDPDIRFNFYRAKKGTVRHYAEGLIIGNMTGIHVPKGGDQTITAEWTAPVNLTLIQLATHQHRLGTYANIEVVPPAGGAPQRIYENTDWQHPPSLWPDPPLRLEKGNKIRITCTWHNTDDHDVVFGPKTTDEMCFILGFYYRDDGDTSPVPLGQCGPSTTGLLCPFAPLAKD